MHPHLTRVFVDPRGFGGLAVWRSANALVLINEVNLRQTRLVLGWMTVSGFDSRGRHALYFGI